jgi:hypothetical protein
MQAQVLQQIILTSSALMQGKQQQTLQTQYLSVQTQALTTRSTTPQTPTTSPSSSVTTHQQVDLKTVSLLVNVQPTPPQTNS